VISVLFFGVLLFSFEGCCSLPSFKLLLFCCLVQDHLERGNLNLKNLKFRVLDEADEMLNMGFVDDVELILGIY
jgi:DEAD/DEAH box helicase